MYNRILSLLEIAVPVPLVGVAASRPLMVTIEPLRAPPVCIFCGENYKDDCKDEALLSQIAERDPRHHPKLQPVGHSIEEDQYGSIHTSLVL